MTTNKNNSYTTFDQKNQYLLQGCTSLCLSDQYLSLSESGDRQTTRSDVGGSKDTGLYKRCADVVEWKIWFLLSRYRKSTDRELSYAISYPAV